MRYPAIVLASLALTAQAPPVERYAAPPPDAEVEATSLGGRPLLRPQLDDDFRRYHLGLAHYLKEDFEQALAAYRECLAVSDNPDMLVATSHWLYMTLRRLGREAEAAKVLEPIYAGLEVIENHDYLRLLLMYRGEKTPEELLHGDDGVGAATLGYGVGNWYFYNGDVERALD
ncbi:MAG TPA: tetratricopeptide repeat protein, partial [Thermoanaerobaculia bacterium]